MGGKICIFVMMHKVYLRNLSEKTFSDKVICYNHFDKKDSKNY